MDWPAWHFITRPLRNDILICTRSIAERPQQENAHWMPTASKLFHFFSTLSILSFFISLLFLLFYFFKKYYFISFLYFSGFILYIGGKGRTTTARGEIFWRRVGWPQTQLPVQGRHHQSLTQRRPLPDTINCWASLKAARDVEIGWTKD